MFSGFQPSCSWNNQAVSSSTLAILFLRPTQTSPRTDGPFIWRLLIKPHILHVRFESVQHWVWKVRARWLKMPHKPWQALKRKCTNHQQSSGKFCSVWEKKFWSPYRPICRGKHALVRPPLSLDWVLVLFWPKLRAFGNSPPHEMDPNKPTSLFHNVCVRAPCCTTMYCLDLKNTIIDGGSTAP